MIRINRSFLISLILLYSCSLRAQETVFSQSNSAGLFTNPAFAGTTEFISAGLLQRIQWPMNEIAIATSCLSVDFAPPIENAGFSLTSVTEIDLPTRERIINAGIGYSHQVKINRGVYAKAGARIGFYHRSIGEELIYGDQYSETGKVISQTMEEKESGSILKPDFEAGALLSVYNFWLSASAKHLSQPNISLLKNGDSSLPRLLHGQIGYRFYLNENNQSLLVLTPILTVFNQNRYNKYSLGSFLTIKQVIFGAFYNGDPMQDDKIIENQSVTLNFGMRLEQIKIQYSYDIDLSALQKTGGTHEIAFSFDMPHTQTNKVKEVALWGPAF